MDGSSKEFIQGIKSVGIVEQAVNRQEFRVASPIWVTQDDKFLIALPYNGLKLSYTISFPNSPIGTQTYTTDFSTDEFDKNLSHARTFGFIEDFEVYRKLTSAGWTRSLAARRSCWTQLARLRIMARLLENECCVAEATKCLKVSQPNTSQHLKALREAGLKLGAATCASTLSADGRPFSAAALRVRNSN